MEEKNGWQSIRMKGKVKVEEERKEEEVRKGKEEGEKEEKRKGSVEN